MTSINLQRASAGAAGAQRAPRLLARAPRLAEWFLLALIAFLLARAVIAFFAPLPLPQGDRLAAAVTAPQGETQISVRNPFPVSDLVAAPVANTPDVAETALDLALTGVWPAAEKPSAIIRKPDGKQGRFAVGEDIVPGVRLSEVYADQVIIEQNGVRESLRFETKAPIERPAAAPAPSQPQQEPSEKIDNFPSRDLLNGFARFGLGIDPKGGAAVMVFAGRDRAAFEQAGFRDGDIIRSINGVKPKPNPADMSTLISEISRQGSASITIERDGAQQTIAFSVSQSGNE